MQLFRLLPGHHLTVETREAVRLGVGMISVLAALVLGLLIASAKTTFDLGDQQLRAYAADLVLLDQTLRHFGPEANPIRQDLLRYVGHAVRTTWPEAEQADRLLEDKGAGELLDRTAEMILSLTPQTESQHWLRDQAREISNRLIHTRWMLLMNEHGTISPILLVIVVIWITVIFASFGMDAPHNATVVVTFLLCSLSIGTSVFLIRAIDTPFHGVIMVSGEPMKNALAHLRAKPPQPPK